MATIPSPATFTAGEKVTAAKMNANVRDTSNFLLARPSVSVERTALQTIATGTFTDILWDTEIFDNDAMVVVTSANLTVQTAGLWFVNARIGYTTNATGNRAVRILKNNTSVERVNTGPMGTHANHAAASHILSLVAGDIIKIQAWHNSGANIDTTTAIDDRPKCQMIWLGV